MRATELTDQVLTRSGAGAGPAGRDSSAGLRVEYRMLPADSDLPPGLLAAVRFGRGATAAGESAGTLCIDVELQPLHPPAPTELWWASGRVERGHAGLIRYAHDDQHLFAVIEIDERDCAGGIEEAAAAAYSAMRRFQQQAAFPHLLRIWNYMDAINEGTGDLERYRRFCVGRVRGLGNAAAESYPAATAIGRQLTTHRLQVYWLAGRVPGKPIENPRQVSAYRYPRAHGPVSPSFARATLTPDGALLISGTASIVGHVSQHGDDPLAQLDETLRNLATLSQHPDANHAHARMPGLFRVYVRDAAHVAALAERLQQEQPQSFRPENMVFLAADICRRELLLEIECLQPRAP